MMNSSKVTNISGLLNPEGRLKSLKCLNCHCGSRKAPQDSCLTSSYVDKTSNEYGPG